MTVLAVVDAAVIVGSAALAYLVWARLVRHQRPDVYIKLLPLLPVFLLAFAKWRLYPGFGLGAVETLRRLSLATTSIFLSLAVLSFAFQIPHQYSRASFAIAWLATLVLVPTGRFLLLSYAHRWSWWGERCVVIGTGDVARKTVRALRRALSLGYRPVMAVAPDAGEGPVEFEGLSVAPGVEHLEALGEEGISVVLVATDDQLQGERLVDRLRSRFRHIILIRAHDALPVDGLEVRNLGDVIGVEFVNQLLRRHNRVIKRALDLVIGVPALLVSLPLIGIFAVGIKLSGPGSVFYVQEREGLRGRRFRLRKLRTMHADAEARLSRHLDSHPDARAEWEARVKLTDDPRVNGRFGRFLRRFSLDELPQLWHVVRGQMSLVGPRPFPEYHLRRFGDDFRRLRRGVRPGLTGLWQVMIRGQGGIRDQQFYDGYYIRNWSLWMDLYVLGKTFAAVLRGRGAY